MLSVNKRDLAIITIKNVDYCCIIHNISKSEAINLLENFAIENCGYIQKILPRFNYKSKSLYILVLEQ